jgi:uncharacterized protein involved in type VI secretion and phage assembly
MANSPSINASGVIEYSIEINGKAISDTVNVESIEVVQCVNRICRASVLIKDGDMQAIAASVSDGDADTPHQDIAIFAGYSNEKSVQIFKGIIVQYGMKMDHKGQSLVLECFDKAVQMTLVRHSAHYANKTTSDVIGELISNYDLTQGSVAKAEGVFEVLTQLNATDWDFMVTRAEQSGLVIINYNNEISEKDPSAIVSSVLEVTYGEDMISFDAQLDAFAKLVGKVDFQGSAKINIGDALTLKGTGLGFNGDVFVSGVTHTIEQGDWISKVQFGMRSDWFIEQESDNAPAAVGIASALGDLMTAKVVKLDGDPAKENRIQVSLPILGDGSSAIWARVIHPYASNGFGSFFMPEVGDEVVLGYFNNDPSHHVILGSVYSSKQAPPTELIAENNIKVLTTRSGHKFEFDDDKKIVTLMTCDGNSLMLNDDEKSMVMTDVNNNVVTLDESGITLQSPKDINLLADGNIILNAKENVDITATADANIEGMNVNATAKTGFTAKGNASAELSASGQTTVKGAMVMIN